MIFQDFPPFHEIYQIFQEKMGFLKHSLNLSSEKMMEDFQTQASAYKNHKGAKSKAHTLTQALRFANLFNNQGIGPQEFDCLIEDGLIWTKALDPALLKGKEPDAGNLHYPWLNHAVQKELFPLIENAGNSSHLLARLAKDCRHLLMRYKKEEEKFSPDDVLQKMDQALANPFFASKIQTSYDAAIIDEFQDTDPLQWRIFQRLFLMEDQWRGYLYLVGDPKQSIYSFRQADIYTYLSAAEALGDSNCQSLLTNYRSQPQLVRALNTLFSKEYLPLFIPLPKNSQSLSYHPVNASQNHPFGDRPFLEKRGAIHFFIADAKNPKKAKISDLEDLVFFPFIASEIAQLKSEGGFEFHRFAVLVRDRFQAKRLADYFEPLHIPYLIQRGGSLAGSPAHRALTDIVRALFHLYDRGVIRTAFCSPLMGWTYEEIKDPQSMEFILSILQRLRSVLFNQGFASFFQEMLRSPSKPGGKTALEQLLLQEDGIEFYRDIRQIADIVAECQFEEWNAPEGIVSFLDRFQMFEENDDPGFKRFQDPTVDAVKILTLHSSKGLEFEIVFALGLVNRTSMDDDLIPVVREDRLLMSPTKEDSDEYLRHCEECDAEKMRQLYVALTRAKWQLYVPAALQMPGEKLKWGEASPMDLYLARLGQPRESSYSALYDRIKNSTGKSLIDFLETSGKSDMSYSIHQELDGEIPRETLSGLKETKSDLLPPALIAVHGKPLWMTSFSKLSRQMEERAAASLIADAKSPSDYCCPFKNVHTLPANRETGLLIHKILEKLSFQDFKEVKKEEEAASFVRPFLKNSQFIEWEAVIAQLIFNALKTPIIAGMSVFCLDEIKPANLMREMPFVFPYRGENKIENVAIQDGFVKGVVDSLFLHDGLYYLLDWKTNWLGSHDESYAAPLLHAAMHENGYFLQSALYKEAVKRYLRLVEKRPFEECFGGAIYLFLRGMQPGRETGVFKLI